MALPSEEDYKEVSQALTKTGLPEEAANEIVEGIKKLPEDQIAGAVAGLKNYPNFGLFNLNLVVNGSRPRMLGEIIESLQGKGLIEERVAQTFDLMSKFSLNGKLDEVDKVKLNQLVQDPALKTELVRFASSGEKAREIANKAIAELNEVCEKSGVRKLYSKSVEPDVSNLGDLQPQLARAAGKDIKTQLS